MNLKHLALVLLTVVCSTGQLCAPPEPYPVDDYPGRLELNDTLRDACSQMSDAEILNAVITMESDRLAGFSPSDEFASIISVCPSQECVTCASTMINQVYGLDQ